MTKTSIINNKLLRFKVYIAALQETHLAGQGYIIEEDFTFFWHGMSVDECREHGVGFDVKNTILHNVEVRYNGNNVSFTHQESDSNPC